MRLLKTRSMFIFLRMLKLTASLNQKEGNIEITVNNWEIERDDRERECERLFFDR